MNKKQAALLDRAADILDQLATKCGGPGGKPGPCPGSGVGESSARPERDPRRSPNGGEVTQREAAKIRTQLKKPPKVSSMEDIPNGYQAKPLSGKATKELAEAAGLTVTKVSGRDVHINKKGSEVVSALQSKGYKLHSDSGRYSTPKGGNYSHLSSGDKLIRVQHSGADSSFIKGYSGLEVDIHNPPK